MKSFKFILLGVLLCFKTICFSQRLEKHTKDSLNLVLDKIFLQDQKYRWMIMFGADDNILIDSLKKLEFQQKSNIIKEVMLDKELKYKKIKDSLIYLQNSLDSLNFVLIASIIEKYGVSTFVDNEKFLGILHHIPVFIENEIIFLLKNELNKRNIKPKDNAIIIDKCEVNKGNPQKYKELSINKLHLNDTICCDSINKNRFEIGLKKIDCKK